MERSWAHLSILLGLSLLLPAGARASRYDLLLKGGHVIDPANGIDEVRDVAVAQGRIAAVARDLPAGQAGKVVDVSGLYVTPGLVDIHVHVGHGGAPLDWFLPQAKVHEAPLGAPADLALASGVTTVVDAGSSGADTFVQLKQEVMDRARVRVLAFLNIAADGMNGGQEQDVRRMDPKLCVETIRKYPGLIVGVKTAHYWEQEPWDAKHQPWTAVDRAEECGRLAGLPVMFDFWPRPERPYEELILKKIRPGDIHTHIFAQQFPIIGPDGRLNPALGQARQRGVIFDLGHGAASFWFRNAVPAAAQGFLPDSLSTDLHQGNLRELSLVQAMSKFRAMDVPLADLVRRCTVNPAREIRRPELGTLSVGREADIAVLEERRGEFGFGDCGFARLEGKAKLEARLTVRAGSILYDPSGLSMTPWQRARPQYFSTPALGDTPPARADDFPRGAE